MGTSAVLEDLLWYALRLYINVLKSMDHITVDVICINTLYISCMAIAIRVGLLINLGKRYGNCIETLIWTSAMPV